MWSFISAPRWLRYTNFSPLGQRLPTGTEDLTSDKSLSKLMFVDFKCRANVTKAVANSGLFMSAMHVTFSRIGLPHRESKQQGDNRKKASRTLSASSSSNKGSDNKRQGNS
jgi:hypothetical protein